MGGVVDGDEFTRWRDEAEGALESARIQERAGVYNWACFMAEQAAQFGIKALLHGLGLGPWGHDLVELGKRAKEALGADWRPELDHPLVSLSRLYIPTRYPDAHASGTATDHYDAQDAAQAIIEATFVLEGTDRLWARLSQ